MVPRMILSRLLVPALLGCWVSTCFAQFLTFQTGDDDSSFRVVSLPGIFDGLNEISADGSTAVGTSGGFGSFTGYRVDTTTGAFSMLNPIPGGVPGLVGENHDQRVSINTQYVTARLGDIVQDEDLSRSIL